MELSKKVCPGHCSTEYRLLCTLEAAKPGYRKVSELMFELGVNITFLLSLLDKNKKKERIKMYEGKGYGILPRGEDDLAEMRKEYESSQTRS